LIPPEVEVIGDDEVYSVEYIKDCCKRKRLQDLKPYRYEFSNMTKIAPLCRLHSSVSKYEFLPKMNEDLTRILIFLTS
jgi:hypothetical protein